MGRGLLTFKGEAPKKKKSKTKQDKPDHTLEPSTSLSSSSLSAAAISAAAAPILPPKVQPRQPPVVVAPSPGTGHVTASGTVVTGHGTCFEKELAAGDAMIVGCEMRVVTMRLSQTSCGISSAFVQENVTQPTPFAILRKPRTSTTTSTRNNSTTSSSTTLEEDLAQRFGTFASQTHVVYREKTEHGSYRIKSVHAGDDVKTRSDLLTLRAKKTSDKFC